LGPGCPFRPFLAALSAGYRACLVGSGRVPRALSERHLCFAPGCLPRIREAANLEVHATFARSGFGRSPDSAHAAAPAAEETLAPGLSGPFGQAEPGLWAGPELALGPGLSGLLARAGSLQLGRLLAAAPGRKILEARKPRKGHRGRWPFPATQFVTLDTRLAAQSADFLQKWPLNARLQTYETSPSRKGHRTSPQILSTALKSIT
jgi:hypothetical protein